MKERNFSKDNMKKIIINILIQTKKACQGRHSLLEVASFKMKFFSFVNDFSFTPQILRGNTKASQKLLLHTSSGSIILYFQEVNSYQQSTKILSYSISIPLFLQKARQLMTFWKVLSVSQGIFI